MRKKCILVFAFLFLSQCAFATTYGWNPSGWGGPPYGSPDAACSALTATNSAWGNGGVEYFDDSHFRCFYTYGGNRYEWGFVIRQGDSCLSGQTYNPTTGQCSSGCPAGQEMYNGACAAICNTSPQLLGFPVAAGAAFSLGSANQCVGSCGYTIVDTVDIDGKGNNCVANSDGSKRCYMDANGTGQRCSGSSGATTASSTPASTTSTSSTTQPTVNTPPGTVPSQSGTTISTTESSSSSVNADGTVTTTTTTITTTTNPDGSTSTSTKTGTSTKQGGNGKGDGSGTGTGTGTGSGGECDPTASSYLTCLAGTQTETNHTTGANAQTFGDALNNFQTGIKDTPIGNLASSSGIGGNVDSGSCPAPSFEFFGHTLTMDAHCTIWDNISGSVSSFMHVAYVIAGILILLSA